MKLKTLIAVALLGAVSAPAMAHDYVPTINSFQKSLEVQHKRLAKVACKQGKMDMCAATNGVRAASDLLKTIPTDISNHELLERMGVVETVLAATLDDYALKGQFAGLNEAEGDEASKALTEVMHTNGWMLTTEAEIMKSEGK